MAKQNEKFAPPHSVDSERAVLGAAIADPNMLQEILSAKLTPEHFFVDIHRKIFEYILSREENSQSLDLFQIIESMRRKGENGDYVPDLVNNCPMTLNVEYYIDVVRKNYYLRRIITACQETAYKAMTTEGEIHGFIEQVEKEFLLISKEQEQEGGLVSAKDALVPTLEEIERRITFDGDITGVTSGFRDLDRFTGGFQKSDLVILAARPGMGKTALALNWLMNAVKDSEDNYGAIFTLEMSKEQLLERLISAEGRIESTKLRKGDMDEDEQDRLMNAARFIHTLGDRLVIDETPGITLMELRSRCRRFAREHNLSIIVIDYLQLMSGSVSAQKQSREREISEISMGLKALAKELAVPIIALAQLNRGPDARPDKRPKISDLRESGSMEQDADQILFVYRDDYYNPQSEHAGKAEVLVSKNRHGETGSLFLAWQPNYVSFFNLIDDN